MVSARIVQCHKDVNSLSHSLISVSLTILNKFSGRISEAFLKFTQKNKGPSRAHAKEKKKILEVNITVWFYF